MHDTNGNPAIFLLKMGQRDHMEQFRKGLLYMNTLNFFRELESDPARADRYEGVDHIFQPQDLVMTFDNPLTGKFTVDSKDLTAPVTISRQATSQCNIFCMYSLQAPENGSLFPSKHDWFGDSVVLILNTQEFFNRLSNAAKAMNFTFAGRLVEYFDVSSYTGKLGRFKKSDKFAHQREWRLAIQSKGDVPLTLDVGDLTDITSEIVPFADADATFKFTEADAKEAGLLW